MQETTILLQTRKNAKTPMNKGRLAFFSKLFISLEKFDLLP